MTITRRRLLAGMAALAGALAARSPALSEATPPVSVASPLDFLAKEVQWAHAELLVAWEAHDFAAWIVDSDDEKPNRLRLARALVLSRELDLSNPLAATVNRELESLWRSLTRPREQASFLFCEGL